MTSWRKPETVETNSAINLADIKMKYKDFAEPFRSANAWVPDGTPVYGNRVTYWEPPLSWNNHGGKISLAGDAAHPMTFRKASSIFSALLSDHVYLWGRGGLTIFFLQTEVKASTTRSRTRQNISLPLEL